MCFFMKILSLAKIQYSTNNFLIYKLIIILLINLIYNDIFKFLNVPYKLPNKNLTNLIYIFPIN
jgi:hypothetical protein